jgi:hypothetical protein
MKQTESGRKRKARVTAEEITKYNTRFKILKITAVAVSVLLVIVYLLATLYKESGSFTVSVNKHEMVQYGLSLCENRDLKKPTSVLNMRIDQSITNIAEEDLPNNLDMIDGNNCGKNHLAYTFYLFNASDSSSVSYEWQVKMRNISNGIDEAIRVRVYVNGVATTYAKTSSDGSGPEPGTVEFYSTDIAARDRVDDFEAGAVTRYTIVVWLDGPDPDCLDWIKGGKMSLEMDFSIVH